MATERHASLTSMMRYQRMMRKGKNFEFDDLYLLMKKYLPYGWIQQVKQAYEFAERAHAGQNRKSGIPYIHHPITAAIILAEMGMDPPTLMAALLHDVMEDTEYSDELVKTFRPDVVELVRGVTKLPKDSILSKSEREEQNLTKLIMAMSQDWRVIIIKLADRLHNMHTLESMSQEKQARIARETLEIYAPLARRLGINVLCMELEDAALRILHPDIAENLYQQMRKLWNAKRSVLTPIRTDLQNLLEAKGLNVIVRGRRKHLYSIHRKMQRKNIEYIKDVPDMYAVRILVNTIDDAYRALGVVHGIYRPIHGYFKDYIGAPKINHYQALHTTVMVGAETNNEGEVLPSVNENPNKPNSRVGTLEIQIRTHDMDEFAENGIAAHWSYKLGVRLSDQSSIETQMRHWLKEVLSQSGEMKNIEKFAERLKGELHSESIYVLSPRGKFYVLPRGARVLDFAYAVHTEVGHRCNAAEVDGNLVGTDYILSNGEIVDIKTQGKDAEPCVHAGWLGLVKTPRARVAIHSYLRKQARHDLLRSGSRWLKTALNLPVLEETVLEKLAKMLHLPDGESVLVSIGRGDRFATVVAKQFLALNNISNNINNINNNLENIGENIENTPMLIDGTEGLAVRMAECCYPLPDDDITGYFTVEHGLTVHRAGCHHVPASKRRDLMPMRWANNIENTFQVLLEIRAENQGGNLARITRIIADQNVDIVDLALPKLHETLPKQIGILNILVRLANTAAFEALRAALLADSSIYDVRRVMRFERRRVDS